MDYKINTNNPIDVNIFPISEKLKFAMYKDEIKGNRSNNIINSYKNILLPFLRKYVKKMNKIEVVVYD